MAGSLYIWIVLGAFVGCGGVMLLFVVLLWVGHWFEKRRTGSDHGFLELPRELRKKDGEG